MGLRLKVLSGFLILAVMLLAAGAWSIYELKNIGSSVQALLDENYRSINAARAMTEALERQDSGVLLFLLERRDEAVAIVKDADLRFLEALTVARGNITIPGEKEHIDAIEKAYDEYRALWGLVMTHTSHRGDLNWYFQEVQRSFLAVKAAVADLMEMNDYAMYTTASNLEGRAHRATMPGIIAIASAFIFSILFSYLVNLYMVGPVINITQGIKDYLTSGKPLNVNVETEDELGRLAESIRNLITRTEDLDEHR